MAAFRIVMVGIGGVGGYYGGKLASKYSGTGLAEVVFIARGKNLEAIEQDGLSLITPNGSQVVHPDLITDNAAEAGPANLLICTVKGYDLDKALMPLAPCIQESTIILPLLNGMDAADKIRKIFPQATIWEGCVYIVSQLTKPGEVTEIGTLNQLHFGSINPDRKRLTEVENIFKNAGIDAFVSENIRQTTWEKFLFISTLATATSYLSLFLGDIISNPDHKKLLLDLLEEIRKVAIAKGIHFSDSVIKKITDRMLSMPPETTSSMHRDFMKGGKTELESLTGYVVMQGKEWSVPTPVYEKIYDELKRRMEHP